jgi:hypothetical protein
MEKRAREKKPLIVRPNGPEIGVKRMLDKPTKATRSRAMRGPRSVEYRSVFGLEGTMTYSSIIDETDPAGRRDTIRSTSSAKKSCRRNLITCT